jgi:hypothetical protein
MAAFTAEALVAAAAVPIVATATTAAAPWLGSRLPRQVDRALLRHRALAIAWALLALVAVAQTGRLATSMTDREIGFLLTTTNPFWYGHECIGAYLHGAELAERGEENIYHASHYPALDAEARPETILRDVTLEDPYQYPPQFLLLPQLALALSHDVSTLRVVWFAIQVTIFVAVAVWLAVFVGGTAGRVALWVLPAVLVSFPALHNFYFGQFHLPAVALAVAGMLAFSRRCFAAGGALLAVAIVSKIFPVVLLAMFAGERRFKACAWTGGFLLLLTLVSLATLGPQPFVSFLDYQLPRLADGAAFAFEEAWPELTELVVLDNQGLFGLFRKLGASPAVASVAGRLFGAGILALGFLVGWRGSLRSRWSEGVSWLALLGLASMSSPGAWGDYVPVTAVWLGSIVAAPLAARGLGGCLALVAVFAFEGLLLGTMPIGDWMPVGLMTPVSAAGVVVMLVLFGWGVVSRFHPLLEAPHGRAIPWTPARRTAALETANTGH